MIVKLCNTSDLPAEGALKSFRSAALDICVARSNGEAYAFNNKCPHQSAPLSTGELDGCMIACPYHAWRFNVITGQPEIEGDPLLVLYEIRQLGAEVFIKLPG